MNRGKPVLLIIDMQNDYFEQPVLADLRSRLADAINDLTGMARAHHYPVVWVTTRYAADLGDATLEMKRENILVCIENTPGAELIPELRVVAGDLEIVKKRYSAFFGTGLDDLLARLGATCLIIAGINTHACIRTTAIDAYQRDYEIILAVECIASYDREHHDVTLRYLANKIGRPLANADIASFLEV